MGKRLSAMEGLEGSRTGSKEKQEKDPEEPSTKKRVGAGEKIKFSKDREGRRRGKAQISFCGIGAKDGRGRGSRLLSVT